MEGGAAVDALGGGRQDLERGKSCHAHRGLYRTLKITNLKQKNYHREITMSGCLLVHGLGISVGPLTTEACQDKNKAERESQKTMLSRGEASTSSLGVVEPERALHSHLEARHLIYLWIQISFIDDTTAEEFRQLIGLSLRETFELIARA